MSIRTMAVTDLDTVVDLHCDRFPDSRSTSLGRPFVRQMYRWFLIHEPALALVSEIDGRVEGFITGSRGGYGRRVFRFALPQVAWGLLRNPGLLFRRGTFLLWQSYAKALMPGAVSSAAPASSDPPSETAVDRVSVASVAVSRPHSGEGLFLLRALEQKAKAMGAKRMSASVELVNDRLIELHLRLGWEIYQRDARAVSIQKHLGTPTPAAER